MFVNGVKCLFAFCCSDCGLFVWLIYLGVGVAFYGGLCLVLIACGLDLDLCFEVFVVAGFVV